MPRPWFITTSRTIASTSVRLGSLRWPGRSCAWVSSAPARNTRDRHIPGLRAVEDVEIVAVCNRRPDSTAAVARDYGIPRTLTSWEELIADPDIDAVVIGTWPYLHCPITLAALAAGKHVLTEARMSLNAAEAHRMLEAAAQARQTWSRRSCPAPSA